MKDVFKWLSIKDMGFYGKLVFEDFCVDMEYWDNVVKKIYLIGFGIDWIIIRNVMDMRVGYGG